MLHIKLTVNILFSISLKVTSCCISFAVGYIYSHLIRSQVISYQKRIRQNLEQILNHDENESKLTEVVKNTRNSGIYMHGGLPENLKIVSLMMVSKDAC